MSTTAVKTDAMLTLQNGFYNAMCSWFGLDPQRFQIVQPSPPLPSVGDVDKFVWNYFNNIPPRSLTQNYIASGLNQFFSNFSSLLSVVEPAVESQFVKVVPQDVRDAWKAYLKSLPSVPPINKWPESFRVWAMLNYPKYAVSGASALNRDILDPILAAQNVMVDYQTPPPRPADWDAGYTVLLNQLKAAPGYSNLTFDSSTMNSDVRKTWTQGSNEGFFGLWSNSSSTSKLSEKFASSSLSMSASFKHVLNFSATPGYWYSSAALGLAYKNKTTPPWTDPSRWTTYFPDDKGLLSRFMVSLVVVESMHINVVSKADYTDKEKEDIQSNSSAGLWPFYASNSSSGISTEVNTREQGKITLTIDSLDGYPVVLGGYVLAVKDLVEPALEVAEALSKAAATL